MGVLADFIATTKEQAMQYDGSNLEAECVVQSKGITDIEMGYLLNITEGKGVECEDMPDFDVINVVDYGESVTTQIMDSLKVTLAEASEEQINDWAQQWCKAEELSCEASDLIPLLQSLKKLAGLAVENKTDLYLWNAV